MVTIELSYFYREWRVTVHGITNLDEQEIRTRIQDFIDVYVQYEPRSNGSAAMRDLGISFEFVYDPTHGMT